MLLRFRDSETQVEALTGVRSIYAAQAQIDALRERSGQIGDVTTSLDYFLAMASMANELPVALLIHRSRELCSVVLLFFRRRYGIPIGLAKAGNIGGQGGVIAAITDRRAAMETAARVLVKNSLVHTVVLSTLWTEQIGSKSNLPVAGVRGQWHFREVRLRLDLSGGREATMARLSQKMRRNLSYYRRRAEIEFGCHFLPALSFEQRQQAVGTLCGQGKYQIGVKRAWQLEAALWAVPGHFAMGLQDAGGNWLSYITGWRSADGTQIDWQLNCDHHENASISTVMRSYLLEHELKRESPAIIFVGETAPFWSRVCEPGVCGDLLATRKGIVGSFAKQMTCRISPMGQVAKLHARATSARS